MYNYIISHGEYSDYEEMTLKHEEVFTGEELDKIVIEAIEYIKNEPYYSIGLGALATVLCKDYGFFETEYQGRCDLDLRWKLMK